MLVRPGITCIAFLRLPKMMYGLRMYVPRIIGMEANGLTIAFHLVELGSMLVPATPSGAAPRTTCTLWVTAAVLSTIMAMGLRCRQAGRR
ncbi:MAG: hypothetical protein MAGBODY4_00442 [Candidatus Marinimicrobia bacterium]|nr:hypothetical protein [Candidatus Neomarinimicrobiota bacterium]